jgi:ABC-type multidrug transport system fused ATPase/permease subunit
MSAASARAPAKTLLGFIVFFLKKQWIKILAIQLFWLAWPIDQTLFPYLFGQIIDNFATYTGPRDQAWAVLKGPILGGVDSLGWR